ncbi:MAG: hypothetical protein RQ760_22075 [Sedimentisphaerales bacterium]|nr:hypothetical protein [Sedimentisphaerales bacterium]
MFEKQEMQEKEEITAGYTYRIPFLSGKSGLPLQKDGYFCTWIKPPNMLY